MKKIKIITIISLLLIFLIVIFMFSNQNGSESTSFSEKVLKQLISTFNPKYKDLSPEDQSSLLDKYHIVFRKIAHVIEYFFLTLFVYFLIHLFIKKWYSIVISSMITIILAVLDEFHQTFIPGRNGSFIDVLIDSIGVVIMTLIISIVFLLKRKREVK